jgi:hypothetical protein
MHGLREPLHAPRHPLIGDLDAVRVAMRARADERHFRLRKISDRVHNATERAQLARHG